MSDSKSKLESLKLLRGEMNDWKKQAIRKKKGKKSPDQDVRAQEMKQRGIDDPHNEEDAEGTGQDSQAGSLLQKLIAKLVK